MRLVFGMDPIVSNWVAARVPHVGLRGFGPCVAIGIVDSNEQPIGGVVYNNYQPQYGSIDISCASITPRWLTKRMIRGIFAYPFDQLKVGRVTAVTPRKATSPRRFLEQFGFKLEGLVRRGFGTDDAVVYGLLVEEWQKTRWMQDRASTGGLDVKRAVKVVRRRRRQILTPVPRVAEQIH